MKFFLFLFSIYFLSLSCSPCGDMDDCKYDSKVEMNAHTDHSDHDKDAENCSPFCMCSCCGQSFNYELISFEVAHNQVISLNEVPKYHRALISEFSISIWQPPKIS